MTVDEATQSEQPVIASPAESARRYRTAHRSSYDLVVIGGGSAGLSGANLGALLGAQVALIDREKLGGECLYTGCVPSKALLHVARVAQSARDAAKLGLSMRLDPVDFRAVAARVQQAISDVYTESDAPEHYIERGIDVIFGETQFIGRETLTVNGQSVTAKSVLVSVGSRPTVPPIPGLAEAGYRTNENVFAARDLPARLVVIGGGPIGVELGQAFARLGSQVTILQRPDRIIPKDEPEASAALHRRLVAEGVTILTKTEVDGVAQPGGPQGPKLVTARTPNGPVEIPADEILVAIGRSPNVTGLGLDVAGVACDARKGIGVDDLFRTSNPRVYAAGDVIGGYLFTHTAAQQARTAVRNALLPVHAKRDERVTPWATFTEPEVAHVGLTEAEARQQFPEDVRVYTQPFSEVDRAVADDAADGFVKLIVGRKGKLLGAQIVGESAGEFINELALVMKADLSVDEIAATTHVYPTVALSLQQAAGRYTLERTASSGTVKFLRRLAR